VPRGALRGNVPYEATKTAPELDSNPRGDAIRHILCAMVLMPRRIKAHGANSGTKLLMFHC